MDCGIILAAGLSSRMGRSKPLLPLKKTTVIENLLYVMREAGIGNIVTVTGYLHDEVAERIKAPDVTCVFNPDYERTGMFESLRLGICALPADCGRAVITPVDAFFPSPDVYKRLLRVSARCIRPTFAGQPGHPVVMGSGLFPALLSYEGNDGLRGFLKLQADSVTDIETDDPYVIMDMDTPEAYRKMLAAIHKEI